MPPAVRQLGIGSMSSLGRKDPPDPGWAGSFGQGGVQRADHPGRGSLGPFPRRADLGGLRARGHLDRVGRGRHVRLASHPAHHHRHRRAVGHPGDLVPAGHRRLPPRRRRLRGLARQFRAAGQPTGRRRPDRRLHPHGGGLHRGRVWVSSPPPSRPPRRTRSRCAWASCSSSPLSTCAAWAKELGPSSSPPSCSSWDCWPSSPSD